MSQSRTKAKSPKESEKEPADELYLSSLKAMAHALNEVSASVSRRKFMHEYLIYRPDEQGLRGIRLTSDAEPLGLYGERLAMVLGMLSAEQWSELEDCLKYFPNLKRIDVTTSHLRTKKGANVDLERARLIFCDQTMEADNDCYFYETAAEGILHFLFCMALVISDDTPRFFAIDNFGNALNPKLCRTLIKEMAILAENHDKQVLISTHNPAVLDGINLHDETQRLFVIARSDEGHTRARRIKLKPVTEGKEYKLSEMWMRGVFGGIPAGF